MGAGNRGLGAGSRIRGPRAGGRISQRHVFQEFFTIINKIFILAGRLDTRLSFYGV